MQLPSRAFAEVLRSIAAIDNPALRVQFYAQLGHYGHNLNKPQESNVLFAMALEKLEQLEKTGAGDRDHLHRMLASNLEASQKPNRALAVAEAIDDLNQRLADLHALGAVKDNLQEKVRWV